MLEVFIPVPTGALDTESSNITDVTPVKVLPADYSPPPSQPGGQSSPTKEKENILNAPKPDTVQVSPEGGEQGGEGGGQQQPQSGGGTNPPEGGQQQGGQQQGQSGGQQQPSQGQQGGQQQGGQQQGGQQQGGGNETIEDLWDKATEESNRQDKDAVGKASKPGTGDEGDSPDPAVEREIDKAANKMVEEIMREAEESGDSVSSEDVAKALPVKVDPGEGGGSGTNSLIPALSKLYRSNNKKTWKRALRKALLKARGIRERWAGHVPSRALEGVLGKNVEVPAIKSVLVVLDCSGSMGTKMFGKVLQELDAMSRIFPYRRMFRKSKVHLVCWDSSHFKYDKITGFGKVFSKMETLSAGMRGGTHFSNFVFNHKEAKIPRVDLHINMTDGHFGPGRDPGETDAIKVFRAKRLHKRVVWVFPMTEYGSDINGYDGNWSDHSVVFEKGD